MRLILSRFSLKIASVLAASATLAGCAFYPAPKIDSPPAWQAPKAG